MFNPWQFHQDLNTFMAMTGGYNPFQPGMYYGQDQAQQMIHDMPDQQQYVQPQQQLIWDMPHQQQHVQAQERPSDHNWQHTCVEDPAMVHETDQPHNHQAHEPTDQTQKLTTQQKPDDGLTLEKTKKSYADKATQLKSMIIAAREKHASTDLDDLINADETTAKQPNKAVLRQQNNGKGYMVKVKSQEDGRHSSKYHHLVPEEIRNNHPELPSNMLRPGHSLTPMSASQRKSNSSTAKPSPERGNSMLAMKHPLKTSDVQKMKQEAKGYEEEIHDLNDLPEWLELTGFHDLEYRRQKLSIYRRQKGLLTEAEELERHHSTPAHASFEPPQQVHTTSHLRSNPQTPKFKRRASPSNDRRRDRDHIHKSSKLNSSERGTRVRPEQSRSSSSSRPIYPDYYMPSYQVLHVDSKHASIPSGRVITIPDQSRRLSPEARPKGSLFDRISGPDSPAAVRGGAQGGGRGRRRGRLGPRG